MKWLVILSDGETYIVEGDIDQIFDNNDELYSNRSCIRCICAIGD